MCGQPGRVQGLLMRFGDRTAPTDQGRWRRFKGLGRVEDNRLFMPVSGFPFWQAGAYRTASETGKLGSEREFKGRLPTQHIEDTQAARPLVFAFAEPSASKPKITQARIDPWSTVAGKGTALDFGKSGGKVTG